MIIENKNFTIVCNMNNKNSKYSYDKNFSLYIHIPYKLTIDLQWMNFDNYLKYWHGNFSIEDLQLEDIFYINKSDIHLFIALFGLSLEIT